MENRRPSLPGSRSQNPGLSAHIYASFAGAGLSYNTNGPLAEIPNMWWDEERIEATVTRQFVASKLRPDEQVRLDAPLGFGDGLTDDTYMEWIDLKAKRMFLILVDLGVPDQIFGVIDDSWGDDDLPIPLDEVERLQLTYERDEKMERRFFNRQFTYLLRTLQKGDHLVYDDEEVVPLELAERKAVGQVTGLTQSNVDKVHLPGRPDDIFIRRKIPLGTVAGRMPEEEFLSGVEAMKVIEHDHLVSLWASYIHLDCGYLLLTPVNDSSLKSFLAVTPPSIKILAKQDRRILLLNWLHCLATAVAFLHSKGLAHKNIKPSTVMLDHDNHIFLGDSGIFSISELVGEKRGFDKETYDYSAPENANRPQTSTPILVPMTSPVSRPQSRRTTLSSISGAPNSPTFTESPPLYKSSTFSTTSTSPPKMSPPKRNSLPRHDPQKADIFSLGTIFLEVITFFLKRATKNFASHRAAKNKTAGRGGGLPDSSFHKNLGQLESWMSSLAKDASKKEDRVFRGITYILGLVEKMVSANPDERPTARYVEDRMRTILTENCGLGNQGTSPSGEIISSKGSIHCDAQRADENAFDFGFEDLRIASQRAAAEACASVNPFNTEVRAIGLNGGLVYGIERTNSTPSWHTGNGSSEDRDSSIRSPMGRSQSSEGDILSIVTKNSKGSNDGKSKMGGSVGTGKLKPKAKQWQAPTYAEISFA